jgi:hypothetical protein
MVVMG